MIWRLVVAFIVLAAPLLVAGVTTKERLFRDITKDYEPDVDPGNIQLKMNIMLLCAELEQSTGHVVANAWEFYSWKDERLKWTPADYGGISNIRLPPSAVWTPDMRQYTSVTAKDERDYDLNVVLMSDGSIIWVPIATYRMLCNGSEDETTCKLRFGSWTYDGNNVQLAVEGEEGLVLSYYSDACPMVVTSHTAQVVSHTYPCCEEPYPSLDVSLVLKPRQAA